MKRIKREPTKIKHLKPGTVINVGGIAYEKLTKQVMYQRLGIKLRRGEVGLAAPSINFSALWLVIDGETSIVGGKVDNDFPKAN